MPEHRVSVFRRVMPRLVFSFLSPPVTRTESFREQLIEDGDFLGADRRLDADLVDKLILQLNRIHPQILTDAEATKVGPRTPGAADHRWKFVAL